MYIIKYKIIQHFDIRMNFFEAKYSKERKVEIQFIFCKVFSISTRPDTPSAVGLGPKPNFVSVFL